MVRTRLLGGEEELPLKQVMEEGEGRTNGERNVEAYALPRVKWIASGELLDDPVSSNQGSATTQRGGKEERAGGRLKTEGTRVNLWLLRVEAWQRPTQYCEAISFQYSAIKKNSFESVLMMWMKLEPIIQSVVSQKEKYQYSILTHIYGI